MLKFSSRACAPMLRVLLAACVAGTLIGGIATTGAAGAEGFTQPPEALLAISSPAPSLTVVGHTVYWHVLGSETFYEVATSNLPRGATGRVTRYRSINRQPGEIQSYTVEAKPGQTVYVGVSAQNSPNWCLQEAVVSAPGEPAESGPPTPEEEVEAPSEQGGEEPAEPMEEEPTSPETTETMSSASAAPVLSFSGGVLHWNAIAGVTRYTLAIVKYSSATHETTYKVVTGTSYTPTPVPGQTYHYGLSASVPGVAPWAKEVSVTYPSEPSKPTEVKEPTKPTEPSKPTEPTEPSKPTEPTKPTEPSKPSEPTPPSEVAKSSGVIIGANDAAGWGKAAAEVIRGGHITWNRVEIGTSTTNTLATSVADGFKTLAIVGNTSNSTPLSQIEPAQWGLEAVGQIISNPGIAIAEAGNEVYYKGSIVNPIQYGTMYLAAVTAMKAAGIHVPLLFNMWGDYSGSHGFSSDTSGGGWLHDAVAAIPGLAAAILSNGISTHPYGAVGENYLDDNGTAVVAAQEAAAKKVLGSVPPFYITEFGYDMNKCGVTYGACSEAEQATKMRGAIEEFLADPHVAGIWWYQSHDDSIGKYGFMNNDNTTRPSFSVLSSFAKAEGQ